MRNRVLGGCEQSVEVYTSCLVMSHTKARSSLVESLTRRRGVSPRGFVDSFGFITPFTDSFEKGFSKHILQYILSIFGIKKHAMET